MTIARLISEEIFIFLLNRFVINNLLNMSKFLKIGKKGGLLNSQIPDLQVYTIKTLLIGRISIKTVFSGPKNHPIRGVPVQ